LEHCIGQPNFDLVVRTVVVLDLVRIPVVAAGIAPDRRRVVVRNPVVRTLEVVVRTVEETVGAVPFRIVEEKRIVVRKDLVGWAELEAVVRTVEETVPALVRNLVVVVGRMDRSYFDMDS